MTVDPPVFARWFPSAEERPTKAAPPLRRYGTLGAAVRSVVSGGCDGDLWIWTNGSPEIEPLSPTYRVQRRAGTVALLPLVG